MKSFNPPILALLLAAAVPAPVASFDLHAEIADAAPTGTDRVVGDPESVAIEHLILPPAADQEDLSFVAAMRRAELIFDGVVVEATVSQPVGTRILVTDYRFEVVEWFKGGENEPEVSITSGGGQLADGSGMTLSGAIKLEPHCRYLIVTGAQGRGSILPFSRVLQVAADGSFVADESGRVVTGLGEESLRVSDTHEFVSLEFLKRRPVDRTRNHEQGPPVGYGTVPRRTEVKEPKEALPAEDFFDGIAAALGVVPKLGRPDSINVVDAADPVATTKYQWCGRINGAWNYFTFLPDDDHWDYWNDSAGNWNTLVADNPSGPDWLIGYKTSSDVPIRNRNPVAGDGDCHSGVVSAAQLSAGGYGVDWSGANGWNFTWYDGGNSCWRIIEVDTFINPAIADDPAQFRKSMTHEMGHALGQSTSGAGGHEDRYFAIMYAGTWRQPPNYTSAWYGRTDDMSGVRDFLRESNDNYPGTWVFENWTDMATWSMTHANPGTADSLVMTDLSAYSGRRGNTVTVRNLHVENRGNVAATDVYIRFYLSWNPTISASDHESGAAYWANFGAETYWANGDWTITIPSGIPAGTYYVGWVITQNESERSDSNNTTSMRFDSSLGFTERTFTVIGNPDLRVPSFTIGTSTIGQGGPVALNATVSNSGDAASLSSTLRYFLSTDSNITTSDTQLTTDYVIGLSAGGTSPESATVNLSSPGTYWLGACVDTVAYESSSSNQCSIGRQIVVGTPGFIFGDGFENGSTSMWSSTVGN